MGSCDVVERVDEGVMNISCSCSLPHFQEDGIECW